MNVDLNWIQSKSPKTTKFKFGCLIVMTPALNTPHSTVICSWRLLEIRFFSFQEPTQNFKVTLRIFLKFLKKSKKPAFLFWRWTVSNKALWYNILSGDNMGQHVKVKLFLFDELFPSLLAFSGNQRRCKKLIFRLSCHSLWRPYGLIFWTTHVVAV